MQSEDQAIAAAHGESTQEKAVMEEKLRLPSRAHFDQLIKYISDDDFEEFTAAYKSIANSREFSKVSSSTRDVCTEKREEVPEAVNYLHLACKLDSVGCAKSILDGDIGFHVPVNSVDRYGKTALHYAASKHSIQCIEFLLKKQARTDIKSKDGQLPLDLALSSRRMYVNWMNSNGVGELLYMLKDKDVSVIHVLAFHTKNIPEIAYRKAIEGDVVGFAVLLTVSSDMIISASVRSHEEPFISATIFEHIVKKVIITRRKTETSSPNTNETDLPGNNIAMASDKYLLHAFELLLNFGAGGKKTDSRKTTSPLILASQAGDALVVKMLLQENFDTDETDRDGNTALHWSLRVSSHTEDVSMLTLLLTYGASPSIKNTVGFTPVHVAASHGHLQGLQILLHRNPEVVDIVTEAQETALFCATKNDHVECARLLLRYGANPQALNLRKQRPIDLAKSKEMRNLLSSTPSSRFDSSSKQLASKSTPTSEQFADSSRLATYKKTEICRYYESSGGCLRGEKCYYAHGEGELRRVKTITGDLKQSDRIGEDLNRKVFIGGLPPSVDSDALKEFFGNTFGPVLDAIVIGTQTGEHIQSRGFGFVTFKDEESVAAAVKTHFVTILSKKVEIKGAVPRFLLPSTEQVKGTTSGTSEQDDGILEDRNMPIRALEPRQNPPWVEKFRKWLPEFLGEVSKRLKDGDWYPLSSLKGDFRATCGMELDHVSLGYLKLSDFIRSMPGLCRMKIVPVGIGPATHMVLLENQPRKSYSQDPSPVITNDAFVEKGRSYAAAATIKPSDSSSTGSFDRKKSPISMITPPTQNENHIYYAYRQDASIPAHRLTTSQEDARYLADLLSAFDASSIMDSENKPSESDKPRVISNTKYYPVHSNMDVDAYRPDPSLATPLPDNFLSFLSKDRSFFTPWANQKFMNTTDRPVLKDIQNTTENSPQSVFSPLGSQSSMSERSVEANSPAGSCSSVNSDLPECGLCRQGKAMWIAVPCAHTLLCTKCGNHFQNTLKPLACYVCGRMVNKLTAFH